jgi:hypothetical protein
MLSRLLHIHSGEPSQVVPLFLYTIQSPKIIMTGLELIPLTFSFEIGPWGQLHDNLLYIGMLQT